MLLKDKLYRLKHFQQKDNQLIAEIYLNAGDLIFEGHFPGNPVTPGVVQLEMIKELLSLHYQRSIQLKSISNCKYLAILNPVNTPEITITLSVNETGEELKVTAVFSSAETTYTKVSGLYL